MKNLEFKGTKGEWDTDENLVVRNNERVNICDSWNMGGESFPNIKEAIANAKLIAAAPDLLEALMSIENDDNSIPKAIWNMRNKAIAKALGESEVSND